MVRTYVKKTTRGDIPTEQFERAAQMVLQERVSIRDAAARYGVNFMTLHRYIKRKSAVTNINTDTNKRLVGYAKHRKIFNDAEEKELAEYTEHSAKIYYGLTTSDLRKLAFQFAMANNISVPDNWKEKDIASKDWLFGFLKRHQALSVRTPEATSIGRATAFNRHNVSQFFNNLGQVYDKYKFQIQDVYNMDETGLTTVQRPTKIIAKKGTKQVGAITSGERGQHVTMALAVNANGNFVPPFLIFPRKKFKDLMVANGPPGCAGASHSSGWMTCENFLLFMKHFVQFVRCSKEKPVLMVLDNHDSHLSIPVLNFCKANGIVLVSFPPHTSHKLQPLDRTVFGPLKRYFNSAADGWLRSNPVKVMSIYDIPTVLKDSFSLGVSPHNIQKGFNVTGIWPYNRDVFQDDEFLPAEVTNRPLPEINNTTVESEPTITAETQIEKPRTPSPQPSTSSACNPVIQRRVDTEIAHLTPAELKPYPKAMARKLKGGRKKRVSAILTDSPIKSALEKEEKERQKKSGSN